MMGTILAWAAGILAAIGFGASIWRWIIEIERKRIAVWLWQHRHPLPPRVILAIEDGSYRHWKVSPDREPPLAKQKSESLRRMLRKAKR